jgi:hypothetical protein
MKKLIHILIVSSVFLSCRKDAVIVPATTSPYLRTVLSHLRDSLTSTDYLALDTNSTWLTNPGKTNNYLLRIGFKGKPITQDFLLVHTDPGGSIHVGATVHLENTTPANSYQFSGSINLRSLSGKDITQSQIVAGHILSLHTAKRLTTTPSGTKEVDVLPAPDADWLPEVVVVGYSGGGTPTPYISLDALLPGAGNGDIGINSGSSSDNSNSSNGGSGGGSAPATTPTPTTDPTPPIPYTPLDPTTFPSHSSFGTSVIEPVDLEPEYIEDLPVINIQKYFNCFDLVPSAGATYSIKLCVDLPINNNPGASMNFSGGVNAGHSFLAITKSSGSVTVTQCFGFYPQERPSLLDPFSPIPSVLKDNSNREINASITMSINSDQFNALKTGAITLCNSRYSLDSWNCTDYALGVFNSARTTPLKIDPYIIRQPRISSPTGISSAGFDVTINSSPQQLYNKLSTMKSASGPEASNIQVDLSHNYKSPASHGECN